MKNKRNGLLPRGSPGDFVLRSSIDYAVEEVDQGLTDVSHVFSQISRQNWYGWLVCHALTEWSIVLVLHSILAAHSDARETLEEALGSIKLFEEAKEAVIQESHSQCQLAQAALDQMSSHLVKGVAPRQFACKILAESEEHVEKMVKMGMLAEGEAHHVLEQIEEDVLAAQAEPGKL